MPIDRQGLFKEFTGRVAKAIQQEWVDSFLKSGVYNSPSGYTARVITSHCVENKIPFTVEYIVEERFTYYVIRLTRD